MSLNTVIHSDNFTDDNGELHYFNTGRDNVSGLSFPNHYVRNKDNYFYTRILQIKLSTDTSLIYPVHESFLLTTFADSRSKGISNIVTVDAVVKEGTIKDQDITVTCTPLNPDGIVHDIKAAIKGELNDDSHIAMVLGIWLDTRNVYDMTIKPLSSLSYNEIPNNIYNEFLQCEYEAYYLNNEDIMYDVNMFNFEESIGTKITSSVSAFKPVLDKIGNTSVVPTEPTRNYQFLSVVYDDLYKIREINVDEVIKPTAFQYAQVDNAFAKINNNYVQVLEEGNYLISLKVDMDIHDGEATKMMMSFFLNDDRIDETTSSMYLDPSNKVYPFGFLAGQVQLKLKPSDKLYLRVRWTNMNNVNIENHCKLQITRL